MPPKIQLSAEESELVMNTRWILTKHIIIKKVFDLFGELNEIYKVEAEPCHNLFPDNIKFQSGKISQGNNYQLLPYVILDYPAFFWKDRIFAIRTMFWWGNFFSVSLHLSGKFKEQFTADMPEIISFLQKHNFYICVNEDEWQHHFEDNNYKPALSVSLHEFETIFKKDFFKVSKKNSLSDWNNAEEFIINSFREILQLLQVSYQAGKKDPSPGFPKAGSDL